jgi:hypothetical protein
VTSVPSTANEAGINVNRCQVYSYPNGYNYVGVSGTFEKPLPPADKWLVDFSHASLTLEMPTLLEATATTLPSCKQGRRRGNRPPTWIVVTPLLAAT